MVYVMLSRVMELSQLFIVGELDEDKIYPDPNALEEFKRMNEISINNNPTSWNTNSFMGLKISALNCSSLRSKIDDIRQDFELGLSDMICLSETWLDECEELEDLQIEDYTLHVNSTGCGKGLATYFKKDLFKPKLDIREKEIQVSKFTSVNLDVISIYRSKNCQLEFKDVLKGILSKKRATLIVGDINICYEKQQEDKNIKFLKLSKFEQLVKDATHYLGGHIDHAYFTDPKLKFGKVELEQYSPYYTARDHDGLLITLEHKQ